MKVDNMRSLKEKDENRLQTIHLKVKTFRDVCISGSQLLPQSHTNAVNLVFFKNRSTDLQIAILVQS